LEDLSIWATITFDIFSLKDCLEAHVRQITMWLWLPHLGHINALKLLISLDEAFLHFVFLLSVALVTSILQSMKLDLWQVRVVFGCRNSSSCHHKMLELILRMI